MTGCIQPDPQKCTGCRLCELICSFTRHGESNPKRARIHIVKIERFFVDVPVVCQQCPDSPCVSECPTEALKKETGIIKVDEERCTGCGICIQKCPFGALSIDPSTQIAIVCDLCQGEPQCVQWCPTGALEFNPHLPLSQKVEGNTTALTVRALLEKWGIPMNDYEAYIEKFEGRKLKIKSEGIG